MARPSLRALEIAPTIHDVATTILVVEDDEPIRLAVRELLEVEGYHVDLATDGVEALRLVAREVPSLVITDLQMPNLDGRELCSRLRTDARTAQIPIVVLTAAHRLDGVFGKADAVIRKPFDIDVLLSTVAQFIRPTMPPRAAASPPSVRLTLRPRRPSFVLYVTAGSASSDRAERTVRQVVGSHQAPLEIIDVHAHEDRARSDGIGMTPTLVRAMNGQREVFLGDLSDPMLVEEFIGGD
ncbi:MAG: response regulator [Deltaproteobacteria bacterium]|nr:response regulator [Deltaproteobacteria bacterium]